MRPIKILLLAVVLASTPASQAQFSIRWSTIDNGGRQTSGGGFTLNGTIGQPDAGAPMSGGAFTLTGGFWAGITVELRPALSIRLGGANTVVLTWPNPSTGFQLEEAPTPSGSGWMTVSQAPVVVAGEKQVTLTPTGTGRMFRLAKP